jgi:hypothetical protein
VRLPRNGSSSLSLPPSFLPSYLSISPLVGLHGAGCTQPDIGRKLQESSSSSRFLLCYKESPVRPSVRPSALSLAVCRSSDVRSFARSFSLSLARSLRKLCCQSHEVGAVLSSLIFFYGGHGGGDDKGEEKVEGNGGSQLEIGT